MADMTNYECIKNMSVEELAEFLIELNESQGTCGFPISSQICKGDCEKCVRNWLNSEVDNG